MENFVILLLLLGTMTALVAFVIGMISPKAVRCQTRGKVALVYPLSALGLFIIALIIIPPSERREEPSQKTTETNTPKFPVKENKEIESSMGNPVQVGHFIYTVQNISFRKTVGDEFSEETADGIYMLVNLSIKNISEETRTLDGSFYAVTDRNGTKYEFSTNAATALEMSGRKTLFLKECQPNITTKGLLVFEVPEKGEYYLHLIGSFWGTNSVRVLLR